MIPMKNEMVAKEGLEPSRPEGHLSLSQACLPVPTLSQ